MLHMFTAISGDFDAPGKTQLGSSVFAKSLLMTSMMIICAMMKEVGWVFFIMCINSH